MFSETRPETKLFWCKDDEAPPVVAAAPAVLEHGLLLFRISPCFFFNADSL